MSTLSSIGWEIPFSLLLLAVLGLRNKVVPRAAVWIKAAPEQVFALVDMFHGKEENWGNTRTRSELVDAADQLYRKTYTTTLSTGVERSFSAQFRIRERVEGESIVIARAGLDGKSLNNELLSQTFRLAPEGDGTRLQVTYEWGPRPLLAQLMARADLWGGVYRLKGLAETGVPDDRPYRWITAAIAICTGLLSVVAFALLSNWVLAVLLVVALLVHEFGHLLAYRMMGQPWGRMVFLPFLGAVAMPRLPFESQGQAVFAALMGPGFSVFLAIACAFPFVAGSYGPMVMGLGVVAAFLNIFNLLPAEPLDGGVALRSVLARLMGKNARFGLMAVGAGIAGVGLWVAQPLIAIFGGLAILANLRRRPIDQGMHPLTARQIAITVFAYVAMVTAYVTFVTHYLHLLSQIVPAA